MTLLIRMPTALVNGMPRRISHQTMAGQRGIVLQNTVRTFWQAYKAHPEHTLSLIRVFAKGDQDGFAQFLRIAFAVDQRSAIGLIDYLTDTGVLLIDNPPVNKPWLIVNGASEPFKPGRGAKVVDICSEKSRTIVRVNPDVSLEEPDISDPSARALATALSAREYYSQLAAFQRELAKTPKP